MNLDFLHTAPIFITDFSVYPLCVTACVYTRAIPHVSNLSPTFVQKSTYKPISANAETPLQVCNTMSANAVAPLQVCKTMSANAEAPLLFSKPLSANAECPLLFSKTMSANAETLVLYQFHRFLCNHLKI